MTVCTLTGKEIPLNPQNNISEIKNALEQRADANTVMRLALQLYGVLTNDNVTPRVYIEKMEE